MASRLTAATETWRRHPFVAGLAADQLAVLTSLAMPVQFDAGQLIFREGEPANRFYLILGGSVALQTRSPEDIATCVATVGAGEVLGWSWLFPPYTWHFDAVAVKATEAIFFYGTWLRHLAEENHELGYELMKRMAQVLIQRLQAARRQCQTTAAPALPSPKPRRKAPTPRRNRER